ncbi:MAG TPA: alpha/beta hydrolase [Polyangiaceae bacterium]|nr:alpha/beta hydrolase [Polyangiaceae bacterium]
MSMTHGLTAWRARGRMMEVAGRRVFALAEGSGETLVVLHGFPTSSHDFDEALPILRERFRVVLHDHPGFGLSEKPERYSYSFFEQTDVALGVWKQLGVERAHVIAHDYGTSIATELVARRERGLLPIELASVTLCNGSVHVELSQLTTIQKLLVNRFTGPAMQRLGNRRIFARQMRAIVGNPQSLSDDRIDCMWQALDHDDGRLRTHAISQYQGERRRFWDRWIGALTRLDLPAHILWGRRDPVAVPAIAETLASEIPNARLTWLEDLGHYPMVEAPERWARAALGFY